MPRYEYCCAGGHVTEQVASIEDREKPCSECGLPAQRAPFCLGVGICGDTVSKPTREHYINLDRFQEAHGEMLHDCDKAGVEPPDCFKLAKERIKRGDAVAIE